MRNKSTATALAALAIVLAGTASAQTAPAAPPAGYGAAPGAPPVDNGPFDAKDLSGVWMFGFADYADPAKVEIPLTPAYRAKFEERRASALKGEPFGDSVSACEAFGMPRVMTFGTAEILQTPGRITVLTEVLHEVRRIWLDGRKMPADWDPSFGGYSTGRWEGDTLVVETSNINANTIDQQGIPMSDQLTVRERLRRTNAGTIENEITLTDPQALTRPWTVTKTYRKLPPNAEFAEYICTSNNRNAPDARGRTTAK